MKLDQDKKPFVSHLKEIRYRLLSWLSLFLASSVALWIFAKEVLLDGFLANLLPYVENKQVFFITPEGAFMSMLKLVMWCAFGASVPFLIWQIYRFLKPGLKRGERIVCVCFFALAPLLFLLSILVTYQLIIPRALAFFTDFSTGGLVFQPVLEEYFGFFMTIMIAFGILFEFPALLLALVISNMVNARMLRKYRGIMWIVSFVASAILTPPDVVSQLIVALPLVVIYECIIWFAYLYGNRKTSYNVKI